MLTFLWQDKKDLTDLTFDFSVNVCPAFRYIVRNLSNPVIALQFHNCDTYYIEQNWDYSK